MKISTEKELKPVFTNLYNVAKHLIEAGKEVLIEVSEFKYKRTNAQNNYYWEINKQVANFFNEKDITYGEFKIPYNKNIVHDIQKTLFGIDTTTKMTIKEFCDYETKVILFWQERTKWNWQPDELPESYLIRKGYDLERNLR